MWGSCDVDWGTSSGQDRPVLPVRSHGPPQPGTGGLGPPPASAGPLSASAAAGMDECVDCDVAALMPVYHLLLKMLV